jgi:hypothetical protein
VCVRTNDRGSDASHTILLKGTNSRERLFATGEPPIIEPTFSPFYDRIACAWLVRRFIDPTAEFIYVSADRVLEVAHRENALPFDVADVELGHHADRCSFDAFIDKYRLDDPALLRLAEIVRGADTRNVTLAPESAGLKAIATGFAAQSPVPIATQHERCNAPSALQL